MALEDLDLILNKDAIITTYPVKYLSSDPKQVEYSYRTHARTHIPLGDTDKYVDTIFKWVGGENKGAFIGAVVGDYGHGKTSFQVHVWHRSDERHIFSVPPFKWEKVSDIVEGVEAWIQYIIASSHAELALKAHKLYESFREKSLRERAEQIAKSTGQDVDSVFTTIRAATQQSGETVDILQVTPERMLDYCAEVTDVLKEAGYAGLLVLLDEPEVTAKTLGAAKVFEILFDIADGLRVRQGDYGVFVSMPENFLAQAQARFASLPARLQSRNCFPRLRDLYGADFARSLWERYIQEFNLGDVGWQVVSLETLHAIGQVASSDRSDLSYGPRTVISAFRRMVYRYKEKNTTYSPADFASDCLEGEIPFVSDYPTRIREILESPDAEGIDKVTLLTLAAFPNGITSEVSAKLGLDRQLLVLSRKPSLVYKRGNIFGLTRLQKAAVAIERDELRDVLVNIGDEFAPGPGALEAAIDAFIEHLIPKIFEPRQGQQILGWDMPREWKKTTSKTRYSELVGTFRQTEKDFPKRALLVLVGPLEADPQKEYSKALAPDDTLNMIVHFRIRWSKDDSLPQKRIEIDPGNPKESRPGIIQIVFDFAETSISNEFLESILGKEVLSPLEVLFLIGEKQDQKLAKEYEAQWAAVQDQLVRELLVKFLGDPALRTQAAEQVGQAISGDALVLLGGVCRLVLLRRYPEYSTLIRQPQWQKKINEYAAVIQRTDVPLSCKRGRETWSAPGTEIAKAFNASLMNLTGGAFTGFDNLISIRSTGRGGNIEVDFRLHPLEEAIMNKIMLNNSRPKRKFEGVECWWIPLEDVASTVLHSGYQQEELEKIVDIGKSRGSFAVEEVKGRLLLYCKPLDLEQMKIQLREKLLDLERETAEFNKLPDFHTSFDNEATRQATDSIEDEADYDSLQNRMNREFEKMHSRLPNYFELLITGITNVQNSAGEVKKEILESREVKGILTPPKATSRWCADLGTYIIGNLKDLVKQVQNECSTIQTSANKASMECDATKAGKTLEKVALLLHGWTIVVSELKQQLQLTKAKAGTTLTYLRDYDKWLGLLSKSDEVHTSLIELKKESSHEDKAIELLSRLDKIWNDISVHLQTRSLIGLGSYKQFYQKLEEVDEERKKYLLGLRSAFEGKKKMVNELLQELDLGQDYRCKEVFNPDDVEGCYTRLNDEAVRHIQAAVLIERAQIESQRQELLYSRDILSRLSQEETEPLITALDDCARVLETILGKVGIDWVLELIEGAQNERIMVKDGIQKSRESVRSARVAVRKSEGGGEEAPTADAEKMFQMIPVNNSQNLKQLILAMMKSGRDSSEALDASLQCLIELFRKSKIRITVERYQK